MSEYVVEVDRVWKRFHRGEFFDSLRDFVPKMTRRLLKRPSAADKAAEDHSNDFYALRDVSFAVKRGQPVGIIGPNGAGKSTLLKVLTRILKPNRGSVSVRGRLGALIEVAAGFHPDLTGMENIYLNGAILGIRRREIQTKLESIIGFAGLEPFMDTPVKRYSSGMQAKLGFSIAAHLDPDVLLIDEVLSVGDAAFRSRCLDHMHKMARSDVSVLFISHNLEQVRQLCQRCLVLDRGQLLFDGDVDTACQRYFEVLKQTGAKKKAHDEAEGGTLCGMTLVDTTDGTTASYGEEASLEISYELDVSFERVGISVNFFTPAGEFITSVSTLSDDTSLPATAGRHRVAVTIDSLPFAGGQYYCSVQLLDVANARTLDLHDMRYPLNISGPAMNEGFVCLKRKWKARAASV